MKWNCYDRNGAYLGFAHGENESEALKYAVDELGMTDVITVKPREEADRD